MDLSQSPHALNGVASLYSPRKRWRSGQRGRTSPLLQRGVRGDFLNKMPIQ
jgi:hypothetical protein